MTQLSNKLIEDVSAASAAYLWIILPEIAKLPSADAFERLCEHFRTAVLAYLDGREGWVLPKISEN
jgi:hypothetical protein